MIANDETEIKLHTNTIPAQLQTIILYYTLYFQDVTIVIDKKQLLKCIPIHNTSFVIIKPA